MDNVSYMFECPVHGLERDVFCWRAFQEENFHFWEKFITKQVEFSDEEKEKHKVTLNLYKSTK